MPETEAKTKLNPPEYVRRILERLEKSGFEAYAVGGCVRDAMLGRRIHDWDVTTSATAEATERLFPRTVPTGRRYGTVTVLTGPRRVEVTTFRTEGGYADMRHPGSVSFVGELEKDLCRRDFTINAMAVDVRGGLTDLFGGRRDIEKRLIRCVGDARERFSEDALRMLRALRFSAQLGFELARGTMDALLECAQLTTALSAERVCGETDKMLMSGWPETLEIALSAGLLAGHVSAAPDTCPRLARLKRLPKDRAARWCALCTALCETGTIADAREFLTGLRLDRHTSSVAAAACKLVLRGLPDGRLELKRALSENVADIVFCAARAFDALYGGKRAVAVREILLSGECASISALAVSGAELEGIGIAPGREMGAALRALLDHVIEHPEDNNPETLLCLAAEMM